MAHRIKPGETIMAALVLKSLSVFVHGYHFWRLVVEIWVSCVAVESIRYKAAITGDVSAAGGLLKSRLIKRNL